MREGGTVPGGPVVELGCRVRFEGRTWTVAALAGGQVRLVAEDGEVAAVLLSLLFAGAGFEVLDGPGVSRVPPLGLLESLPEAVRERAFAWERHVREVETGLPGGPGSGGLPRAEYDPGVRTLAQRDEAKAAELSASGMPASAVTVRRMRARYRREGVWGLVDHRTTRPRSVLGRADERVVLPWVRSWRSGRSAPAGHWDGFGCIPGACWPSGTDRGRCRCRRLRRSTGSCMPSPTGAGCWAARGSASGGQHGRLSRSCRRP
ncbi:hypothetical protein [Streptomyces sp. NPDC004050]